MEKATIKTIQLIVFDPKDGEEEGSQSVRMGVRPDGQDKDALQWLVSNSRKIDEWQTAIGCNPFEVVMDGKGFSLIGKRVMIETESMTHYEKIITVSPFVEETKEPEHDEPEPSESDIEDAPLTQTQEIPEDDIPF